LGSSGSVPPLGCRGRVRPDRARGWWPAFLQGRRIRAGGARKSGAGDGHSSDDYQGYFYL